MANSKAKLRVFGVDRRTVGRGPGAVAAVPARSDRSMTSPRPQNAAQRHVSPYAAHRSAFRTVSRILYNCRRAIRDDRALVPYQRLACRRFFADKYRGRLLRRFRERHRRTAARSRPSRRRVRRSTSSTTFLSLRPYPLAFSPCVVCC